MGSLIALTTFCIPVANIVVSQPKVMTQSDPNDKYSEYEVDFHGNVEHSKEEFDSEHDAELNNPEARHRDKLLDRICDDHPSSPMCKVYDD